MGDDSSLRALGEQMEQQRISLNAAVNSNGLLSNDWASIHFPDRIKKTHADLRIPSLHREGRLWDHQLEMGGDGWSGFLQDAVHCAETSWCNLM